MLEIPYHDSIIIITIPVLIRPSLQTVEIKHEFCLLMVFSQQNGEYEAGSSQSDKDYTVIKLKTDLRRAEQRVEDLSLEVRNAMSAFTILLFIQHFSTELSFS